MAAFISHHGVTQHKVVLSGLGFQAQDTVLVLVMSLVSQCLVLAEDVDMQVMRMANGKAAWPGVHLVHCLFSLLFAFMVVLEQAGALPKMVFLDTSGLLVRSLNTDLSWMPALAVGHFRHIQPADLLHVNLVFVPTGCRVFVPGASVPMSTMFVSISLVVSTSFRFESHQQKAD